MDDVGRLIITDADKAKGLIYEYWMVDDRRLYGGEDDVVLAEGFALRPSPPQALTRPTDALRDAARKAGLDPSTLSVYRDTEPCSLCKGSGRTAERAVISDYRGHTQPTQMDSSPCPACS